MVDSEGWYRGNIRKCDDQPAQCFKILTGCHFQFFHGTLEAKVPRHTMFSYVYLPCGSMFLFPLLLTAVWRLTVCGSFWRLGNTCLISFCMSFAATSLQVLHSQGLWTFSVWNTPGFKAQRERERELRFKCFVEVLPECLGTNRVFLWNVQQGCVKSDLGSGFFNSSSHLRTHLMSPTEMDCWK